jgi:hypothetical protein
LHCSLDWQSPVLLVPTSSQIRLFSAPNQGNTISRALTVILSRRVSSSRFHRRHSNKSSSKPPTSAIKVILTKLAPAFRSLCLFRRWLLLPGESMSPSLLPANAQRAAHVKSPNLLPASLASSHLQTKQLQPGQAPTYLGSPADKATPARLGTQAIMPMYAYNSCNQGEQPPPPRSQSSREAVSWGSSTFNLPYRVWSSAAPLEKHHFFFSTLKKIQSAAGSYASKVGALASRFGTG